MQQVLFPDDVQFWYETLRSFGHIAYGGADFGEVLAISEQITAGDYDSWHDAYLSAADRLAGEAQAALRAGHRVSARDGWLRASNYYRSADFFLHGHPDDPRHHHAYDRSVACFQAAAPLLATPAQPVAIPYENTTLPGYFYAAANLGAANLGADPDAANPAADLPRPIVIMHTGFDGSAEEMHFAGAAAAAERGYHVLVFDGPGQAGPIHRQGLVFRPDWENVVGPVIDFALTLPGVDTSKIVLWGLSMGGVLAPRAAAFDHRLAALVAVDGVYDMGQTARGHAGLDPELDGRLRAETDPELDAELAQLITASPVMRWAVDQAQYVFGAPSPRRAAGAFLDYHVRDGIAEQITCPALICDAPADLFFAGQARQLFDHLTCPKTWLEFTAEEGADAHCQVGAQRLAASRILNWLDGTLAHQLKMVH
ncbi:MAG TPA: alpha/beta fold hydrolase [Streptosporangiaceae bacterium]|jgi:alpha-beta hydrolase superfamily lysophospholipase